MKQAILITAYKDFDNLVDIIRFFDNSFNFYIHIDKKSKLSREQLSKIKTINNVKILSSKYKVNWGGLNHLKAILFLANKALKEHENHFFHLISGQDFPIQKLEVFKSIGLSILPKDYLEYFKFPLKSWDNENGGFDRIEYYHLYDIINAKRHIKWLWRIVRIQKKIRYKRAISSKLPNFYGGSTWWSLSRETLNYVVSYTKNTPVLIKRLTYTFCPEEYYFQTVIMNSKFKDGVVNNNLRYIDWESTRVRKYSQSPAILTERHLQEIEKSDCLFARKFETPQSNQLKEVLIKNRG